jgi:signal transduction histidine kinase
VVQDIYCVSRIRVFRTASFRLAAIYLALFTLSAGALGGFVYLSVRHEILADFDARIIEETDALRRTFVEQGRDGLAATLSARGSIGGALLYGLQTPDRKRLAGDLVGPVAGGWTELTEDEKDELPEGTDAEIIRALVTRLPDGSTLIVGDELRRANQALRGVLSAFGWAIGATIVLGLAGGLWLSGQFLRRIDAMRLAAQAIMAGDWTRRIPLTPIDDDLSALARTFNRLFGRIEKLLLANKHISADIAHDLRKPLASVLRRLEGTLAQGTDLEVVRSAVQTAIIEIENLLETFNALLRIGQVEAGARRAGFRPLDLADIAREVVEAFQPAAEDEGKTVALRLDEPLSISGDKELLTQMIANIIDNALRHAPKGVRVEVAGERMPGGVRLSVADDGPGVDPRQLKLIFERFYRADARVPLQEVVSG